MHDAFPHVSLSRGHFKELTRAQQVIFFLSWLPSDLHHAPGIDWQQVPDKVMQYCIYTIRESPDAGLLALAAAIEMGNVRNGTLVTWLSALHLLLRTLRNVCGITTRADLQLTEVWQQLALNVPHTAQRSTQLIAYTAYQSRYFPCYVQQLQPIEQEQMQMYALPPLPNGFRKKYARASQDIATKARRGELRELLLPLNPILLEMIHLRKAMADRLFQAIWHVQRQVEAGKAELPAPISYTDCVPMLNSETMEIKKSAVTITFTLWNKATWALHHRQRISKQNLQRAITGRNAYQPDHEMYFLEYPGGQSTPSFWFIDLIEQRVLQHFTHNLPADEDYTQRWHFARSFGFSRGVVTSRPGLLTSADRWLAQNAYKGDLLFEPYSLQRGILYAAALANLVLSHKLPLHLILQVSADRWQEDSLGLRQQGLLPARRTIEHGRQPFPLTQSAISLLDEIARGLEHMHGKIPIVYPSRQISQTDYLTPERYLFQWAANSHGSGILEPNDIQVLVRFILYGIEIPTSPAETIRLSLDLLREVSDVSLKKRENEIERIMGFNHTILASSLSPASLNKYCHDFYRYVTFATTKERALQPEMLVNWQKHLQEKGYAPTSIQRMLSAAQSLLKEARKQGLIEQSEAQFCKEERVKR